MANPRFKNYSGLYPAENPIQPGAAPDDATAGREKPELPLQRTRAQVSTALHF